ncbi:hypothetical protein SAMN05421641_12035 [Paracoccus thiocyanatus]|uniref:Uncharacterized protein n=1 Tax=Paracoccus thiocyanatus TaxID=34006 RepID=A0A1N6XAV2_9RHOB|nr:hypothetical protein [Paracoccus thiocyanatus]SIQ99485.1 hypothetical protein SAMN05421641_12035 [Paracoccus thiocyanatus]
MKQLMTTLEILVSIPSFAARLHEAKRQLHKAGMNPQGDLARRRAMALLLKDGAVPAAARAGHREGLPDPV